jgi:uncharacterized protein
VHQDGLVHVSQLSDSFVKDPQKAVSVGQIVTVRVLEADPARKRISLSMKKQEPREPVQTQIKKQPTQKKQMESSFGESLRNAFLTQKN